MKSVTTMSDEKRLKFLGYNRVSTVGQAEEGFNLEQYEKRIRAACESRGWELLEVHTDAGKSAREEEGRPAYQAMMKRFRSDPDVDGIIVYKLDRFHRNLRNALRFFEELEELGKQFVSVSDSFDTSTAMGRAMLRIALVFAELESEQIAERVSIGRQASIEAGFHQAMINPIFWLINRDDPRGTENGAGLVMPTDALFAVAKDREEGRMSWWALQRKYGYGMAAIRRNYKKYQRWKENPVHGFVLSKKSKILAPRISKTPLTKEQKERRDRATGVILREKTHFQETGELLYSSVNQLAKACGVHLTTLYTWHHRQVVDIGYRLRQDDVRASL